MIGLRDAAALQLKTIELQSAILAAQSSALTAQSEQFSLVDRIRSLEADIAKIEAWADEKQRYKLTELGQGTFAYTLKEETDSSEPPHKICANCYNSGEKGILQLEHRDHGQLQVFVCHRCGAEVFSAGTRAPEWSVLYWTYLHHPGWFRQNIGADQIPVETLEKARTINKADFFKAFVLQRYAMRTGIKSQT